MGEAFAIVSLHSVRESNATASTCVGDKGWIGFGMMDREYD
ncbi:hypothetical protein [Globicatella sp. HMSC072A10]|nr:hypothetical protein [Globicatella sp. HMSC072A10]